MELELSTSPRATWVWAADVEEAERVREILGAAGCSVHNASGRNSEPRVLDLDIGVDALAGLEALNDAGYSFQWHPDQSKLNRGPSLFGIAVREPRER